MAEHSAEPTQPTQPKGTDKDGKPFEPVEIPVPTRGQVMEFFRKVMRPGMPPEGAKRPSDRL